MTSAAITYDPDFYKTLSCLFFSIAASDKHIVNKEKRKIIELVDRYWLIKKGDLDSKTLIYSELKSLIASGFNNDKAFENFQLYYKKHQDLFSYDLRKKIMDSAYEIASAYAKRNKSELLLLSKLHLLLFDN